MAGKGAVSDGGVAAFCSGEWGLEAGGSGVRGGELNVRTAIECLCDSVGGRVSPGYGRGDWAD